MSTYSNVPSVSNFVSGHNRADVSTWTVVGSPGYINHLALFVCPADSYAVIRGGIRNISLGIDGSAGLTMLGIGSFESGGSITAYKKINKATCMCAVGGSNTGTFYSADDAKFESIYVGPGQTVYAVAADQTNPNGIIEVAFQGVLFTNGL